MDPRADARSSRESLTKHIDDLCDTFEAAWRADQTPRLEELLKQVPVTGREQLFREALFLEVEYRSRRGEQVRQEALERRFPGYGEIIREVLVESARGDVTDAAVTTRDQGRANRARVGPRVTGQVVAGYTLLQEIGRGGMGVVYKAHQHSLNRVVAVKLILPGNLASGEQIERFHREAEIAGSLQHANIVAVHEVRESDGQHLFAMDFVEGRSLEECRKAGPISPRTAAAYIQKVAQAIQYAHDSGTLHRDLKPSNILIDELDEPRVTDFGLAKRTDCESTLTGDETVLGTPGYMSPEQARGRTAKLGRHTDVYGLGATLYAMLAGRPPFQADSVASTLDQVVHADPVSPRVLNPSVDEDLETICLKCLEKEGENRFATAIGLAEELQRYLTGSPLSIRPVGPLVRAWRWYCHTPEAPTLTAGGLTVSLAVILLLWGVEGLVVLGAGLYPVSRPGPTVLQIALLMGALYGPMLWVGHATLNGHGGALWLGLLAFAAGLFVTLFGITGRAFDAEVWGQPHARFALFSLLLIMCFVGCLVHLVAIIANRVRRARQ